MSGLRTERQIKENVAASTWPSAGSDRFEKSWLLRDGELIRVERQIARSLHPHSGELVETVRAVKLAPLPIPKPGYFVHPARRGRW